MRPAKKQKRGLKATRAALKSKGQALKKLRASLEVSDKELLRIRRRLKQSEDFRLQIFPIAMAARQELKQELNQAKADVLQLRETISHLKLACPQCEAHRVTLCAPCYIREIE